MEGETVIDRGRDRHRHQRRDRVAVRLAAARATSTFAAPICTWSPTPWSRPAWSWRRRRSCSTGWLWLDPVTSLVIVGVIFLGNVDLLRDSLTMALTGVPRGIDPRRSRRILSPCPASRAVHDLHIWPMSTTEIALTAHLVVPGGHPGDEFLAIAATELRHRFGIGARHLADRDQRGMPPGTLAPDHGGVSGPPRSLPNRLAGTTGKAQFRAAKNGSSGIANRRQGGAHDRQRIRPARFSQGRRGRRAPRRRPQPQSRRRAHPRSQPMPNRRRKATRS